MTEHPELAAEYDRLRAEADLRYAVALPGAALAITLAVHEGPWWALAFVVAVLLVWQARRRDRDAADLIADALLAGATRAPAVDRLRGVIAAAPARTGGGQERPGGEPVDEARGPAPPPPARG